MDAERPPDALNAGLEPQNSLRTEQARQAADEKDDDGKVSRWKLGSSSLKVLEQFYQMEPCPGAPLTFTQSAAIHELKIAACCHRSARLACDKL